MADASFPSIATATVISQDPDNYALNVSLHGYFGTQMPGVSVQVLTHGPRDGVRGNFPELPLPGQLGVICFPRGDSRSGIWVGAISPALNDASTLAPGLGTAQFAAHFGGGVSSRSRDGSLYEELPDGTTILIGHAPTLTRHTVGSDQERSRTPFTRAERVSDPPTPFPVVLTHPTGATATLSAAGDWTLTSAPGGTVNMTGAHIKLGNGGTLQALLKHHAATTYNSHSHPGGGGPSPLMTVTDETTVVTAE